MTQKKEVKRHLQDEGALTSFEAFSEYGITRLSAIIFDLRAEGNTIKTESVTRLNRYGNSVTFAKYKLIK